MSFNLIKYTLFILLFSLVTLTGCRDKLADDFDGDFELKIVGGNNQTGVFNELLSNEIIVEFTHPNGEKPSGYKIIATTEFGRVLDDFKTTEDGLASFEWELGCGENQAITFWLYGTECDLFSIDRGACLPFDSVVGTATAIQENGWVKGCGLPDTEFFDVQFVEIDNGQYLLVDGIVYRSVDDGLSWNEIPIFFSNGIEDQEFLGIEINPFGGINAMLSNHSQYLLDIEDFIFVEKTLQGEANLNSNLGGFTTLDFFSFAAFGSDGIFWDLSGRWESISPTIGFDEQFYELESTNNRVYGIYGSITEQHLIYSTNDDFTEWENVELPEDFFFTAYGDFLILPDETAAIGSGTNTKLSEFNPIGLTEIATTENIQNNGLPSFGKSIKDLVFYNNEIYFLGFDKNFIGATGSIWKGKNGDFEALDFDGPCNNILFYDIRNDGSFIVGCANGIFVFKG